MSFINAKKHLEKYHLENKIIELDSSTATVRDAAIALHCEEKEIAKTLGFLVEENPILIVTAGDQKIDNKKFKEIFHERAKMIPFDDVEEKVGHAVGGVCPFGIKEGIPVYLDESLKQHSFVYPACGSHNSGVKLTIEELMLSSEFTSWIDVCKEIEKDL